MRGGVRTGGFCRANICTRHYLAAARTTARRPDLVGTGPAALWFGGTAIVPDGGPVRPRIEIVCLLDVLSTRPSRRER